MEFMKKFNCSYLLIFCVTLFASCRNADIHNRLEYIRFVENEKNGLLLKEKTGNYLFCLQYKPVPYMILTDNENIPMDPDKFLLEEKEYNQLQYFTLRIARNNDAEKSDVFAYNASSSEQYDSLLHYFETDMKNDIRLIAGDHSYIATSILYERENDRGEFNNFLISFPAIVRSEVNRTFVFNDRLLDSGIIRFTLEAKALSRVPELKL